MGVLDNYYAALDRGEQDRATDASRRAGNALAGGNSAQAANMLYQGGYLNAGADVQKNQLAISSAQQSQQDAQRKREAEGTQRLVQGIYSRITRDKVDPNAAFDEAVQYAPALGIDPAHMEQVRPYFQKDPAGFMKFAYQQAAKDLQFFQTEQGLYVGDKNTGQVSLAQGLPSKAEWKEVKNADGSTTYIDVNDPRNQNAPVSQAPVAAAPTSAARGIRNNNPLNLTTLGNGRSWDGQTGADGRFATFASPEAGLAAADKNLRAYNTRHGINTVSGIVSRWAPASENDTQAYIHTVSTDLGVRPDQPLNLSDPGVRQRVLQSMAKVEVGQTGVAALKGGAGGDQLSQPTALQGRRVPGSAAGAGGKGDGKWEVYTDPKTNNQFRYNAATHEATTLDGSPYTPGALAKLAGGGAPRSANGLALQRFLQENPNASAEDVAQFNATFNMQKAATTAFGTGKQGQTINSLNVSIDHLSTLAGLATALDNGDVQLLNRARQTWMAQTGNAAPANFEAAKQIVADEIVKGIVGAGGGVADRDKAQAAISNAASPQQLAGVIGTYKQLLAGQLNGLRLQYKNTTGRGDFEAKLLPETRTELEGLNPGKASGGAPAPAIATRQRMMQQGRVNNQGRFGTKSNPYSPRTEAEMNRLPVGSYVITPDGHFGVVE